MLLCWINALMAIQDLQMGPGCLESVCNLTVGNCTVRIMTNDVNGII